MPFQPFDPEDEVRITRQNLPHWRQDGVTYFVTSRLADSIPRARLEQWKEEREAWMRAHGLSDAGEIRTLPDSVQREFQRAFTKQWYDWLDAGEGECVLRQQECAAAVVEQMVKGHPDEYEMDAWVIMPNHLHALVTPRTVELSRVLQRWKGASARFIHRRLGRSGTLWQAEAFDHIVRSEEQLEHFRRSIADNPLRAGLRQGEFFLGGGRDFSPCVLPSGLKSRPRSEAHERATPIDCLGERRMKQA